MVILTLFESLTAGIFITIVMLIIGLSLSFSLLLGAIGCATAPASTIMTIRQYKARGPFVDTILQAVALDDAVSLIAFSVCAAFVQASSSSGSVTVSQIAFPVLFNLLALALGGLSGVVLSRLIHKRRSKDHSLVLACVTIMGVAGICTSLDVSPLLACMASGTAYINASGNKHLFKQLNQFTPPLLVMFFVLSGMRLSVPSLAAAGVIGIVYFLVRIAGKYTGSALGAAVTHASPEIRRYFGLALIPQAGVSIGLAVLGQRILPAESGQLLSTIILSSGLLYEWWVLPAQRLPSSYPVAFRERRVLGSLLWERLSPGRLLQAAPLPLKQKMQSNQLYIKRTQRSKASDSSKETNTAVPARQIPQRHAVT